MRPWATAALAVGLVVGCKAPPDSPRAPAAPPPSPLRFVDVAAEMGVDFTCGITDETPLNITRTLAGGVGFLDWDNDGWDDLVLVGLRGIRLYHNEQGAKFRDVTSGSGLDQVSGELQGLAAADYDADGLTDLLITRFDGVALMKNMGGGRFEDRTAAVGLGDLRGWASSAAFADVNGDGWLDLFVGRYIVFEEGMLEFHREPGEVFLALGPTAYEPRFGTLYLNLGGGKFREATVASGLGDSHGKTLGVVFADFDQDGDQDLYLANDQAHADFFVNDGTGHFQNQSLRNGTALSAHGKRQAGMGADWGDYNRDGKLDLFVTTFHSEVKSLYRQESETFFTHVSQQAGLLKLTLRGTAFGVTFSDFNNDGWEDLMIANGHVQDQIERVAPAIGYHQTTNILVNEDGVFRALGDQAGTAFTRRIVGKGLAVTDWDHDGRLDVAIANFVGPPLLLHNQSDAGNWIAIRLIDDGSNRQGLGAIVTLTSPGGTQVRSIQTSRGYMAAHTAVAHFGLAGDTEATAQILWPDGGRQQVGELQINAVNEVRRQ